MASACAGSPFPIAASLVVGSVVAATSAVGIAWALGVSPATLASLVPKSVTAPVAMGIAERIGGLPALAAVFAVATGVVGAVLGRYVFDAVGVRDLRARGFALGLAAHGIGTARAFQVDREPAPMPGSPSGCTPSPRRWRCRSPWRRGAPLAG